MTHQSESAKSRSPWTDVRIGLMKELYAEKLPCSRIAVELNNKTGSLFSRNAIIGMVHRLKLERRGGGFNGGRKSSKVKRSSPRPRRSNLVPSWMTDESRIKAPTFFPDIQRPDVMPLHISLALLDNTTCRWPYGDGPFTFCGCEVLDGPYCFAHKMQSIGRGTESERSAAKVSERAI